MGKKETSLICKSCQQKTLHTRTTPNHVLHLLLSIITGGLWIIVWILASMSTSDAWRCSVCGSKASGAGWGTAGEIYRRSEQKKLARQIESTMKICPQCAEEVKAAAKICRFCNHQFADQ